MKVFHSALKAQGNPRQAAANMAFHLATLLAGVSAGLTMWQGTHPLPLMLACLCILVGLYKPVWFHPLVTAWYVVLNISARILLTVYWCLYILPMGLSMQLRGHDPLQRQFNPKAASYWQEPHPPTDMRKLN